MIRARDIAPPPAYAAMIAASLASVLLFAPIPPMERASGAAATETALSGTEPKVGMPGIAPAPLLDDMAPDLTQRPLVAEGRRFGPPTATATVPVAEAPTPAAPAPVAQVTPKILYKGYLNTGTRPRALVAWSEGAADEWASVGDKRDGWEILQIRPKELWLTNGASDLTVSLYETH